MNELNDRHALAWGRQAANEAREGGLGLLGRVELLARGDYTAAASIWPRTEAELTGAYSLACMLLVDLSQSGGDQWLDLVRQQLIAGAVEGEAL